MNRRSTFRLIACLNRFGLGGLFLFAAVAKLFTINSFVGSMVQVFGIRWAQSAAITIVLVELAVAILLFLPRTIRAGGATAALLLFGFAVYALYYVYILDGEPLECGCFGRVAASQLGISTALRNLILIVPAMLLTFNPSDKMSQHEGTAKPDVPPAK